MSGLSLSLKRLLWSLIAWWGALTGMLWLAGEAFGQPTTLAGCAASAAVLVAAGEAGDWLRRRRRTRRPGRSPGRR